MRHRVVLLSIFITILVAASIVYVLVRPAAFLQNNDAHIADLKSKAQHDDDGAAYLLGDMYLKGQKVKRDLGEAYWINYNGVNVNNAEYMRLSSLIDDRLSSDTKKSIMHKTDNDRMIVAGHTVANPFDAIRLADRYCYAVAHYTYLPSRQGDLAKFCEFAFLADQGDLHSIDELSKISPSDKEQAKGLAKKAKDIRLKAEQGDIPTLVTLGTARKNTDRKAYATELFSRYGVVDANKNDFPIRVFDQIILPPRVNGVGWQDNQHIIYALSSEDKTLLSFQSMQDLQTTFNVDVRTSAKLPFSEKAFNGAVWASKGLIQYEDTYPASGCRKILGTHISFCFQARKVPSDLPRSVKVLRDDGTSASFDLQAPYESMPHFDPASNTYWIEANEKLWRFDSNFKSMTREIYPKGLWGGGYCMVNHGVGVVPCTFLETSFKHGFVVNYNRTILDNDSAEQKDLFYVSGVFLVTKDGHALSIYDTKLSSNNYAVSPDGCNLAFIKYSGLEYPRKAQLAVMDLCTYFEK